MTSSPCSVDWCAHPPEEGAGGYARAVYRYNGQPITLDLPQYACSTAEAGQCACSRGILHELWRELPTHASGARGGGDGRRLEHGGETFLYTCCLEGAEGADVPPRYSSDYQKSDNGDLINPRQYTTICEHEDLGPRTSELISIAVVLAFLFCSTFGCALFKGKGKCKRTEDAETGLSSAAMGTHAPQHQPVAQPIQPTPQQQQGVQMTPPPATILPAQMMQVTVPPGVGVGQPFLVTTPNGAQMQVIAPPGSMPGGQIMIQAPAPQVVQAVAVPRVVPA